MKSLRIVFLSVLLLFLVNLVWGQKSQKPRLPASAIKTSAKIDIGYSMYDSAVSILEEGVQCYPDDAEMHYLLGEAYFYKKNYPGMGEQFATAESLKSDAKWNADINEKRKDVWLLVFNQGAKYFNEKNYDTAMVKFVTCTNIDRSAYKGFLYAGLAYTMKKEFDQAIPYLKTGLKLSPDNPEMLKGYADVMLYSGNEKEALDYYKIVLEKDPKNVEVLINLVAIYSKAKDFDQALDYSQKLTEADPNFKDGFFNMGTIYLAKIVETNSVLDSLKDASGEYLKDEKSAAKIKELTEKKNGYLTSAQSGFEKALQIDSTDMEAQVYLSEVYQEEGNIDKALMILEPLVEKDSTNCDALRQIAIIYAKKGVGEKAKVAWQKAQDCLNKPK
ncbi:MAG: tetratricopeptide repeat protein [Candidatus Zixiibacteriota bacterium]